MFDFGRRCSLWCCTHSTDVMHIYSRFGSLAFCSSTSILHSRGFFFWNWAHRCGLQSVWRNNDYQEAFFFLFCSLSFPLALTYARWRIFEIPMKQKLFVKQCIQNWFIVNGENWDVQRNSRRTALSIEQTCIYYCMDDGKYSDLEFIGNSHIISKKNEIFLGEIANSDWGQSSIEVFL